MSLPDEYAIRTCEGCHGFESLHNIQVDSDSDTIINVGSELIGYGHIGNNDDCWGCHGFLQANAPGTGPVTPFIGSSDVMSMITGTDTVVTLTGEAFTNLVSGFDFTSSVVLTAADSSSVTLTPNSINSNQLVVTIPGTTAPGNYFLRAVKGSAESNPVVISVKPAVTITDVKCVKRRGRVTIKGTGFGEKLEGTDAYMNVKVNGETADIISWNDSRIKIAVSRCSNDDDITVNALYGSASTGSAAPPKP
jgi:hypothetical protein